MISYSNNIKPFELKLKTCKNIGLNALPVYDDRYIRMYGHTVYTNFCGLNMPEDGAEREFLQLFP